MNITELKEGKGIIFKTENEKERILPVLHFLGYKNLFDFIPAVAASKMTGSLLYVNIEADKKLTYSTAQNWKVDYTFSLNITIPPGIQWDMQLAELKPFVAHVGGFIRNDAVFDKAWDSIFTKLDRSKGCVWGPSTKVDYPPYLYDITPQDALTLISFLDLDGKIEFKNKWGGSILDSKPIVATGLTKQKYLNHCRNKHRDEANKLFKMQCPYKYMELILVRHYESNDWMPRFFYKLDSVEGVWVHGQSSTTPILYKLHCKAKVSPA